MLCNWSKKGICPLPTSTMKKHYSMKTKFPKCGSLLPTHSLWLIQYDMEFVVVKKCLSKQFKQFHLLKHLVLVTNLKGSVLVLLKAWSWKNVQTRKTSLKNKIHTYILIYNSYSSCHHLYLIASFFQTTNFCTFPKWISYVCK